MPIFSSINFFLLLKNIHIERTRKTPEVLLNPDGVIKIEGRSIPEDASLFFDDILEWIYNYVTFPKENTLVEINLEYLNSGTSKYVLQILKKLSELTANDHHLIINWYYEEGDDDIQERGEYYASILDLKINYFEIE